ncbi:MAG: hypothetical protein V4632_16580 [Pseudomonadota bacterium]
MPIDLIHTHARQKGAVLVTTSILLVAILILGLVAIMVARSELKISGNLQYQTAALDQAETAVAAAETWLKTGTNFSKAAFTARGANDLHLYPAGHLNGSSSDRDPLRMSWNDNNSLAVASAGPRYLIERIASGKSIEGSSNDKTRINLYRIIARGESARGSVRFVQTIFSVRCFDVEQKLCSDYN